MKNFAVVIIALIASSACIASEAISVGKIDVINYRGGYLMVQIKDGSTNHCQQCGVDPSGMAAGGYCWVDKEDKTLISIILTSYAGGKDVWGRVSSWESCSLYQFHSGL